MKKQQNIYDAALEYMEQKYGEKFEYVAPTGTSYAQNSIVKMFVSCASLPEDIFVEGLKGDNGFSFKDNYLAVKYKPQVIEEIQSIALNIFTEALVVYEVLPQSISSLSDTNASFEAYSSAPDSGISARIYLSSTNFVDSLLDNFAETFQKTGIAASITLVVVESAVFPTLSAQDSYDIDVDEYRYFCVISFTESGFEYLQREAY